MAKSLVPSATVPISLGMLVLALACVSDHGRATTPFELFVESVGGVRLGQARLPGGFRYGEVQRRVGSENADGSGGTPAAVRIAAARVEQLAESAPAPDHRTQAGVARLVLGDLERGIAILGAVTQERAAVDALVALSAAYLWRFERDGATQDLAYGLEAALHGIELDAQSPESWFNAAAALESLGLAEQGRRAWLRAASLSTPSGWAAEARARARDLGARIRREERIERIWSVVGTAGVLPDDHLQSEPDIVREVFERLYLPRWAEVMPASTPEVSAPLAERVGQLADRLAVATRDEQPRETWRRLRASCAGDSPRCLEILAAYARYVDGRTAWDTEHTEEAYAKFAAAQRVLSLDSFPESGWIDLHLALRDYYAGRLAAARRRTLAVAMTASRSGYTALEGRARWMVGLLDHEQGQFSEAFAQYQKALDRFARCRDRESAGAVNNLLADYFRLLGEPRSAWAHQARVLSVLDVASRSRQQPFLTNAAVIAASEGQHRVELAFLRQSVAETRARGANGSLALALGRQARALTAVGQVDGALRSLAEARQLLTGSVEADVAALVTASLDIGEGQALARVDPRRAVDSYGRAIHAYRTGGSAFDLPALLLGRGQALAESGRFAEAESDWRAGVAAADDQRRRAGSHGERVALHAARWDLYSALVDLRTTTRGDPEGALSLLESARAINTIERLAGQGPIPLPLRVPAGSLAIVYLVVPLRTHAWVIGNASIAHFSIPLGRGALTDQIERYRRSAQRPDDAEIALKHSSALFDAVLGPAREALQRANRLIVVPDGPLHALPFASLWDRTSRTYVVERSSVLFAPSLRFALLSSAKAVSSSEGVALVVGPSAPGAGPRSLPFLKGADEEAEAVSAGYERHVLLRGGDATRARFLSELRRASVVHFAGHAIFNRERPDLSRLVLTPANDDPLGGVFVSDIEGVRLTRTRVVVLAACESGLGTPVQGEGTLGLVRGFLVSGATAVVATLWRIDDARSRALFQAFHAAWRSGLDAPEALRHAQLIQLRAQPAGSPMSVWAAPILVGRTVD